MIIKPKIKLLSSDAIMPTKGSEGAAALDVYAAQDAMIIPGDQAVMVGTGIAVELPENVAILLLPRSGLSFKQGLVPVNSPGLIDPDYRGEIKVAVYNRYRDIAYVRKGERIAQIMFIPFYDVDFQEVEELGETERAAGGFGSTGTN